MIVDRYAGAGRRWATGATLVYGPIADLLVGLAPHEWTGRTVLDVGAGTGAASAALESRGAGPVAVDLSYDMLAWNAARRPPAAVADAGRLPVASNAVDDAVAAFVLNHLVDPGDAFAELVRVIRPGGVLLACVYSTANTSPARDRVDEMAHQEGWQVPGWYLDLKAKAVPVLGNAPAMGAAARAAGLVEVRADERPVDVGVTEPEQLVDYRLGQAHFADWLDSIGPDRAGSVRARCVEAARPIMQPYRPVVVFLSARVAPPR